MIDYSKKQIYLLHIKEFDGWISHYIGITTTGRVKLRIAEHKCDPRNRRLYARIRTAIDVQHQILESGAAAGLEQFYIRASEQTISSEICNICRAEKKNKQQREQHDHENHTHNRTHSHTIHHNHRSTGSAQTAFISGLAPALASVCAFASLGRSLGGGAARVARSAPRVVSTPHVGEHQEPTENES
jgi:hypothetical protein